jgi:general secretion pathway protein C
MTLSNKSVERIGALASLVMVIVLGVQLAWWGWYFFAPSRSAAPVAKPTLDLNVAQSLFGPVDASAPATASAAPAQERSDVRLRGVFAVDGVTPSAAVLNVGGRDITARINEKINDSITLVSVEAEHVIISRNGAREKIELDAPGTRVGGTPSSASASASTRSAPAGTANFRLNVAQPTRNSYALSRSELNTVLQDPRQINFLGSIVNASGGGVQIQDASPGTLASKLGLQPGDVIKQINGQPVNSAGDLARFYGQFGTTSNVRAEVMRQGTQLLLTYQINH